VYYPTKGNISGVLAKNDPKSQDIEKSPAGSTPTFACIKLRFFILSVCNYLCVPQGKKGHEDIHRRKEEKSQEVYISRMCGATAIAGGF